MADDVAAELGKVIQEIKALAKRYYMLTGKPLGVTAEVAEYEAGRILGLELCGARQPGYDALWSRDGQRLRVQIKGRVVDQDWRRRKTGGIKLDREWDVIVLVLLNQELSAESIYEADRTAVAAALRRPGSRGRNERGQLTLSQFVKIGRQLWPTAMSERPEPPVP